MNKYQKIYENNVDMFNENNPMKLCLYDDRFRDENPDGKFKKTLEFIDFIDRKLKDYINHSDINKHNLLMKISKIIDDKISVHEFFTNEMTLSYNNYKDLRNKVSSELYSKIPKYLWHDKIVIDSIYGNNSCICNCLLYKYNKKYYRLYNVSYIQNINIIKCVEEKKGSCTDFFTYNVNEFSSIQAFEESCSGFANKFRKLVLSCIENKKSCHWVNEWKKDHVNDDDKNIDDDAECGDSDDEENNCLKKFIELKKCEIYGFDHDFQSDNEMFFNMGYKRELTVIVNIHKKTNRLRIEFNDAYI